jgi:hypothetical protein
MDTPHDIGWFSFVVSHLSGKNKNAAKVGHRKRDFLAVLTMRDFRVG